MNFRPAAPVCHDVPVNQHAYGINGAYALAYAKAGEVSPAFHLVDLSVHVAAIAAHVILRISDHALYHFAADRARLTRGQVAVVTLLQVDVERIGNFGLEAIHLRLRLGNKCAITCHRIHLLFRMWS